MYISLFLLVGEPIPVAKIENPTYVEIEALQNIYIDALRKLFNENKEKYEKDVDIKLIIN
jgi:Diacylglycerol acyltransferase.